MQYIRQLFLSNDVFRSNNDTCSPTFGIWTLLVNKNSGRIWDVDDKLAMTEIDNNRVWATGSAFEYALGADFTVLENGLDLSLEERIRIATKAAIVCDINCPGIPVIRHFT